MISLKTHLLYGNLAEKVEDDFDMFIEFFLRKQGGFILYKTIYRYEEFDNFDHETISL